MPTTTPINNARKKVGRIASRDNRQAKAAQMHAMMIATMIPSSASWAQLGGCGGVQQTTPCRNPKSSPTNAPDIRPNQKQSLVLIAASRVYENDDADPTKIIAAD